MRPPGNGGTDEQGRRRVSAYWRDRRVLVTGCTGLLGSWLTERLVSEEAEVVGLVRDRVPRSRLTSEGLHDRIDVVWGAVEDYELLERTLGEYEVRTVFHLAAQTIVGVANRNPLSTFEANTRGTWQLLEASRRSPTVEAIVVASSDKAYGAHPSLPYDEDTPLAGRHPYDVSKSCADLIAQAYMYSFATPACVTRFGNLFGGGDLNWNRIVPGTIRSVVRGESPIVRSDGTLTRDYVYVEDAAAAYLLLAEQMTTQDGVAGQAFNFSYEHPLDVMEVVNAILEAMERKDLEPVVLGEAMNEIPHQYLSSRKARDRLGWTPTFDFDEGLRRTVEWYRGLLARSGA
jgi:CDP-glucose 4,6-dehydratase